MKHTIETTSAAVWWGNPILDAGLLTLPCLIFEYYAQIGVTGDEFLALLHLASEQVHGGGAFAQTACRMGCSEEELHARLDSLVRKGILTRTGTEYSAEKFVDAILQAAQADGRIQRWPW